MHDAEATAASRSTGRLATDLLVVAGFCAFLSFFGLGSFGLIGADEPRYAQIAREMLARHDWVTPVLYGKPWLEKPVLYYWEAMLAFRLFGVSDWAARVPSAVDATALVFAVHAFARRFLRGVELDAALTMASFAGIIGFARAASTDMPLTATFGIGMLAWAAWLLQAEPRSQLRPKPLPPGAAVPHVYLAGFYVFLALATLAKGPVAPFLAALIILLLAVLRRDGRIVTRTLWIPGILLYLLVALPWYVLVEKSTGTFFRVFIFQHNLERFGTPVFRHVQPFWYYGFVLPLALAPWVVFAITGLISPKPRVFSTADAEDRDRCQRGLTLFLVLWALVPPVFFSFSGSKLPGYILPAVPPFALLLAAYLRRKLVAAERANLALIALHSLVTAATLSAALLSSYIVLRLSPTRQAVTVAAVVGAIVFGAFVLTLRLQGLKALRFVTLIPVIVGLAFVVRFTAPLLDTMQSARPVERAVAQLEVGTRPVAGFNIPRELEYGLAFYRNQPVAIYNRAEIPAQEHLLIAHQAPESTIQALVPNRRLLHVGSFVAQGLEFYWVSLTPPPSTMEGMEHMNGEHHHSHQMK